MGRREEAIRQYFRALLAAWGPQDWWPARTQFEVIVGAYLTQNTSWTNVEKALSRLRAEGVLTVSGIRKTPRRKLEQFVRSAGYFRQKALRLKIFLRWLDEHFGGSLAKMFAEPTPKLREKLLELSGVGPETADSMLLYAGGHASFVVDSYTRRILARHGVLPENAPYEEIRELFQRALEGVTVEIPANPQPPEPLRKKFVARATAPSAEVYNEYHALLVQAAKHHCLKKAPLCSGCPLEPFLPQRRATRDAAGR